MLFCINNKKLLKCIAPMVNTKLVKCPCSSNPAPKIKKRNVIFAKGKTFIDWKRVFVKAGNGGSGSISFVHSRDHKGGPNGGDGGTGGDVIFVADQSYSQFAHLNHQCRAKNGGNGAKKNRHGKNGDDLIIQIPPGTNISNYENGKLLADLLEHGETFTVAKGGTKGLGNVHFKSPMMVRPKDSTEGGVGEELFVELELKSIADVGLIGFPNAGKSSLLHCISRAKPKIGDYPFTTLKPNIGVMNITDDISITVADIPGIIQGAHENVGLGHEFLRHIERCHMLLYVMDCSSPDMMHQFDVLKKELDLYKSGLSTISSLFVANKSDLVDDVDTLQNEIQQHVNMPVVAVSAKFNHNIEQLRDTLSTKWRFKKLENTS